jgi:hypothetical protein
MKKHIIIFLCGLMVVAGTACKNENTPENKTVQKRHLTIKVQGDEGQSTKVAPRRIPNATIDDMGTTLSAEWTAGDIASYCNLSRQEQDPMTETYAVYTGSLTAASTGKKSDLDGDVECLEEDYLAVVYPANNTFEYISAGTQYFYTFPFTGQDGTLARIANHYNQQYGRAHVLSVTDKNAEAVMDKMQSLLTVCKFSFQEKTTGDPIPVGTLTISYKTDDGSNGKYPQTGKVTVKVTDENSDVKAEKEDVTAPLTITCASELDEVYVALLPEIASRTYNFTVTNNSGTYTGTASAWLKKGEFVPATGLKLTKND